MARPKKEGRRATGIQAKHGYLYIVLSQPVIKDGKKKIEKKWITTGLADSPENIKNAVEMRRRLLEKQTISLTDRNITTADYIALYLDKKRREVADSTYSAYMYKARRISDAFGPVKIRNINNHIVEQFLDSLFDVHHASPRTVKDIKAIFAAVMEQAQEEGLIAYNPVKEVVVNKTLVAKYTGDKNTDDEFFNFEEAQRFLDSTKDHELYELFYVTVFFGLRREEVLGLRWPAISFKDKSMRINHTVTKGTTVTRANTTKTVSSERMYPLTDEQVQMFKRLREKELANRRLCGNGYYDSDYVFKHDDGSRYYPDYPTKAFKKLVKKIPDLPQGITFHGLRTSCVSILVHQHMDVKSIQKWVGHKDIDTTLRIYAKVKEKESKKEIADKMAGIITIKTYNNQP